MKTSLDYIVNFQNYLHPFILKKAKTGEIIEQFSKGEVPKQ